MLEKTYVSLNKLKRLNIYKMFLLVFVQIFTQKLLKHFGIHEILDVLVLSSLVYVILAVALEDTIGLMICQKNLKVKKGKENLVWRNVRNSHIMRQVMLWLAVGIIVFTSKDEGAEGPMIYMAYYGIIVVVEFLIILRNERRSHTEVVEEESD